MRNFTEDELDDWLEKINDVQKKVLLLDIIVTIGERYNRWEGGAGGESAAGGAARETAEGEGAVEAERYRRQTQ